MATHQQNEGAWIFVSHSNRDFERVRMIRNELENQGHYPLLFFLKCLGDAEEIHDLLRREIDARNWFLLCRSTHTEQSKWVKQEMEIIQSLPDKVYREIDLDSEDPSQQLTTATALARRATVFLSYAREDQRVAMAIHAALREQDVGVFWDLDIAAGAPWQDEMVGALEEAARRGWVLLLLSGAFARSSWTRRELTLARRASERLNLIPIVLEDFSRHLESLDGETRGYLESIQPVDFRRGPTDAALGELVSALKRRQMRGG